MSSYVKRRAALVSILERLDLSLFPARIDVGLERREDNGLPVPVLAIGFHSAARDAPHEPRVTTFRTVPPPDWQPTPGRKRERPPTDEKIETDTLRWLRDQVRRVLLHELDEAILVGGERRFDPHHHTMRVDVDGGLSTREVIRAVNRSARRPRRQL